MEITSNELGLSQYFFDGNKIEDFLKTDFMKTRLHEFVDHKEIIIESMEETENEIVKSSYTVSLKVSDPTVTKIKKEIKVIEQPVMESITIEATVSEPVVEPKIEETPKVIEEEKIVEDTPPVVETEPENKEAEKSEEPEVVVASKKGKNTKVSAETEETDKE